MVATQKLEEIKSVFFTFQLTVDFTDEVLAKEKTTDEIGGASACPAVEGCDIGSG